MKKLIMLMMGILLLISFASAEIYLYNDVVTNTQENTTTHHIFYKLEDTSDGFRWRNKGVPVIIEYSTQVLPFSFPDGTVDWCNLTLYHNANSYDSDGNYLSTNTTAYYYNFTSGSNIGDLTITMKDADDLFGNFVCHYNTSESVYEDNILVGRLTTYTPTYECKGCGDYTLEELSNETARNDEIIVNQVKIYNIVSDVIELNYKLWLYASWIAKIFFLIVAIGFVFSGVYFVYRLLNDIARRI